ncbi:Alpha-(1-_6)-mannopyranosyltransferase B [Bienertia sinuspersici]
MDRQTCEQQTSGDFGNNRSDKPKSMKSRLPFLVNGWPTDVVYDAKEEVATIGLLWAGWGCWCGSVALPMSRGHSRQVSNLLLLLRVGWGCWCGPVSVAARISCAYSVVVLLESSLCANQNMHANGKVELVSGPIQSIDVLSSNGRRYFVEFNELHQPLRKGGHILVKFLGYIAKMGNYCPLGALTWHKVEKKIKM